MIMSFMVRSEGLKSLWNLSSYFSQRFSWWISNGETHQVNYLLTVLVRARLACSRREAQQKVGGLKKVDAGFSLME